jgi:hypothetical protein
MTRLAKKDKIMTRNGKIARLSGNIREELNQRMEDGQEGPVLLEWLNSQLKMDNGQLIIPITKQNLSEWRQGGFREWQIRQEWFGHAAQLADSTGEMEKSIDLALLPGALAAVLAARYAAVLHTWDGEPNEKIEAQLRLLRRLNQDIALLQKTLLRADQQKRELEEAAHQEDRRENEELRTRTLNMLQSVPEREALAAAMGGGEQAKKLASAIVAVKYDLPFSKEEEAKWAASRQAESKPVQPSPTKSKRIKTQPAKAQAEEPPSTELDPASPSPTESNPVRPKTMQQIMKEAHARSHPRPGAACDAP